MRCFLLHEEYYEVHTHWGWFRLDEGAYRDYLAGKLWITWVPGNPNPPAAQDPGTQPLPPDVTADAVRLRDAAVKRDLYIFLQEHFPGMQVSIPYKARMRNTPIDEMALTVRSSNGLMRAGASTFGKLWELMNQENGLRSVRNLGMKSESEIIHSFFAACYLQLSLNEQAVFWQKLINSNMKTSEQFSSRETA